MQALELGTVLGAGCGCSLQEADEVRCLEVGQIIALVKEVSTTTYSKIELGPAIGVVDDRIAIAIGDVAP